MRKFGELTGVAIRFVCLLLIVIGLTKTPALGQSNGEDGARIEGELSIEFETDHIFNSDDPDNEITDSYATIELGASWIFNPYFSINGNFTAEPVLDPDPGKDRMFFKDTGLYVGELYAQFQVGPARLFGGKFGAAFGQAWDLTPGLYGTAFTEDYELAERVGLGVGLSGEATLVGDLELTASTFTIDTSGLSNSIIVRRGRAALADGGAGNTGALDSFSLTLDGRNIPQLDGIAWHLGYSHQAKGRGGDDISHETGYVAGLYGSHKLSEILSFEWVGEISMLDNAGGGANDARYYTLGGVLTIADRYNVAIAHTTRVFDVAGGMDFNDHTSQISAGMQVFDGWTIDVGYQMSQEENIESQTVGVLLGKTFEFGTGN